ncbi:unnamed protein product [Amoebophrya sp. A120]|nr:unnamed protein product [Amoebophrya sp. A120]|eukprot:GSA120T00024286001.1
MDKRPHHLPPVPKWNGTTVWDLFRGEQEKEQEVLQSPISTVSTVSSLSYQDTSFNLGSSSKALPDVGRGRYMLPPKIGSSSTGSSSTTAKFGAKTTQKREESEKDKKKRMENTRRRAERRAKLRGNMLPVAEDNVQVSMRVQEKIATNVENNPLKAAEILNEVHLNYNLDQQLAKDEKEAIDAMEQQMVKLQSIRERRRAVAALQGEMFKE